MDAPDLIRLRLSTPVTLTTPDPRWPLARLLTQGNNITIVDGGPGKDLVINSTGGAASGNFKVYIVP